MKSIKKNYDKFNHKFLRKIMWRKYEKVFFEKLIKLIFEEISLNEFLFVNKLNNIDGIFIKFEQNIKNENQKK